MCRPKNLLLPVKAIVCLFFCFTALAGFAHPNVAASDTDLVPGLRTIGQTENFWPQGCTGMVQDPAGFIWISTMEDGLFRFDGKNLRNYKSDKDNAGAIASNSIYNLYEDSHHRLWLFFKDGRFDAFDPLTEKVRHFSAEVGVNQKINELRGAADTTSLSLYQSRSVFEDARHRIWTVTGAYMTRIDEAGKGSIRFFINAWPGIPNGSILSVNETAGGNLLLVTTGEIVEVGDGNRIVRRTPLPAKAVANAGVPRFAYSTSSMSLRKGDTLYAACPAGVVLYNIKTGNIMLQAGLPSTCVDAKAVVSPGKDHFLFYDTAKANRLYEYTLASNRFKDLGQYRYSGEGGSSSGWFYYLYDRFGNLWHSGRGMAAIYQSTLAKPPFRLEKFTYDPLWQLAEHVLHMPEALSRKTTILPDMPIIATPEGASYYITRERKFVLCVPAPYAANRVKEAPRWTVIVGRGPGYLCPDNKWRDGKLWVYDKIKEEFFTIDTLGNTAPLDLRLPAGFTVNSFATTDDNRCWITFFDMARLALYQPGKGLVKTITRDKGRMPLPNLTLQEIIQDKFNKHVFWIFTGAAGLMRFNEEDETWQLPTEKDTDHPSHNLTAFMQDWLGYFWYANPKGIFRFDSRTNTHQRIVSAELLPDSSFRLNGAMYHIINNTIVWQNDTHFITIQTDSIKPVRNVAVALTGLQVNNRPVESGDSSGLMPVAINALPELPLTYDQNFLRFQFAALEFNQPGMVRYRYQMENIDRTWVEVGDNAEAQYTSLPPGHYTFKVNATNENGSWSREIKTLRVIISPPWWRTWWAYAVYAMLLLAAGWLFMRTRLRRLQLRQQVILKQKEAEQAQAMEETKSRFFANVTHELRTPLTLILSPVQKQLQEGAATYSPQLLQGVYQNAKLLLRLINQLLDMGKLEGGNMQVTLSRGNLVLFMEGIVNGFRQQAAARAISLSFQHEAINEEYLFDADKLEKILYNLLSNAFKFTADGGDITVSLQTAKEADNRLVATISVADSGIGIALEHLPQVFDRFYQVNTSTTRRYEGTGIGLSLVKELTELMGGGVKAESVEGKGSVFTVSLPLAVAGEKDAAPLVQYQTANERPVAEAGAPATVVPSEEEKKPVVLIVDDNEPLRRFIAESLAPQYRVLTAVDGQSGLQTALAELPELILSDVMMPVMDGYEFCQKVKEAPLTGHIGFVMLTAKIADESRMSGLRLGADHYLGKPFNVEELLLVVSNLLKRQQALREHYRKQLQPAETLPPVNEVEDAFLRQVYAIIEANLDSDKLDVDFLASELAVSRRTLNRKLSAIADTSANEIIRHYRLKKGAVLLLAGHNVSEAAYATGFSTPSWFSQCFKEMYGLSPVQYTERGGLAQN